MTEAAQPATAQQTDTALRQVHTKASIMATVAAGMPLAIMNLLLTTGLRDGEVSLQRVLLQNVPPMLNSAALPGLAANECLLPWHAGAAIPNFADDLATTLPLFEEVRLKYPRFHYRIGSEFLTVNDAVINGYRVDIAEPAPPPAPKHELVLRNTLHGPQLPLLGLIGALDFLLDQPGVIERVAFHMDRSPPAPAPDKPTLQ